MSNRPTQKELITRAVLEQLPKIELELESVMIDWWQTGRQDGLRLTARGDAYFKIAEIEFFDCPVTKVPEGTWYTFILEISQKIKSPYYLHVYNKVDGKKGDPFIRIYDSRTAMMIGLYGTLNEYLDSMPGRKFGQLKQERF